MALAAQNHPTASKRTPGNENCELGDLLFSQICEKQPTITQPAVFGRLASKRVGVILFFKLEIKQGRIICAAAERTFSEMSTLYFGPGAFGRMAMIRRDTSCTKQLDYCMPSSYCQLAD